MAFKPFKKIKVPPDEEITSKHINAVQDNVSQAIGQLLGKDVLDLKLLKNVTLLPGIINKVSHGLGRKIDGWLPVGNGGYAFITDKQDSNKSPELLLYLTTPALVTVNLIVF